jgi:hypothetical protein
LLSSPEHGQEYDEEEDATLTIHIGPWDNVIVLDIQKLGQMKSLSYVHATRTLYHCIAVHATKP